MYASRAFSTAAGACRGSCRAMRYCRNLRPASAFKRSCSTSPSTPRFRSTWAKRIMSIAFSRGFCPSSLLRPSLQVIRSWVRRPEQHDTHGQVHRRKDAGIERRLVARRQSNHHEERDRQEEEQPADEDHAGELPYQTLRHNNTPTDSSRFHSASYIFHGRTEADTSMSRDGSVHKSSKGLH